MRTVLTCLNDDFRIRLRELLRLCSADGLPVLPYCTMRTCAEQAVIYRRSRTTKEIKQKIQSLTDRGYPFLADALASVGPQTGTLGAHKTMAAPGESWHQYALAADCVPLDNGKAVWDSDAPEWQVYGKAAKIAGLYWAGSWRNFQEFPHVQLYPTSNPLSHYRDPDSVRAVLAQAGSIREA